METLRHLIRNIGSSLGQHRQGPLRNVALIASQRSGTTILAEALGRATGVKFIDQPFSPFTASVEHLHQLPSVHSGQYIWLSRQERAQIASILQRYESGAINFRGPWRFWDSGFKFRTDRIIYKITNGHYLAELIAEQNISTLYMLRHPLMQAHSLLRNGWKDNLSAFYTSHQFRAILNRSQLDLLDRMIESEDLFGRHILVWFCENLPLYKHPRNADYFLYYENVVNDPQTHLGELVSAISLNNSSEIYKQFDSPSRSAKVYSTDHQKRAIREGGSIDFMQSALSALVKSDHDIAREIFDAFEFTLYDVGSILPVKSDIS